MKYEVLDADSVQKISFSRNMFVVNNYIHFILQNLAILLIIILS
jgi:hypothetical protein